MDDLTFTLVPEPSTFAIISISAFGIATIRFLRGRLRSGQSIA
jgi:hypothetical protein